MEALDDVLRVIASLNEAGVEYVVVGGVALNLHGLIRATEDLDVFIKPDAQNVERLRDALHRVWDDPDIDQITAADLCGEYPVVRYGPPEGSLYLDIMTRLGEATAFADLEVQQKTVEGVPVRVASPRTLYRMKRDTVRPIDRSSRCRRLASGLPARGRGALMPVQKFRSVRDMPSLQRASDDTLAERIRVLWRRSFQLAPGSFRRGVTRFRSIEQANDARQLATIERMRASRAT